MKKNHGFYSLLKLLFGLSLLTAFSLIFASCEVGLGQAVDTYPPTLTLDYPANDGITIRDTFLMKGVAKDETYVRTVVITVKSVKDSSVIKQYSAELDSKAKNWECKLNNIDENGKYEIPDGEYTFEVLATDSSDRTTELSRVYKIDNTAPIVIIKRPKASDSYGRTIKITGDIAEQNELGALYFTAFKNTGSQDAPNYEVLGSTQKFTDISKSGLEVIAGRYFDSDKNLSETEKTLKAVYDALYDSETGGSQSVYCIIQVTDSALKYTGESDKSEIKGNISSCYYIDSKIHKQIYNDTGWQLTNNDLISIFNGSYIQGNRVSAAAVKAYLAENCMDTSAFSDKASIISLDPDNSPYFVASGYEASEKRDLIKKSEFSAEVYQGRDQIELDTDTIRLVLDECDSNGKAVYQGDEKKSHEIILLESLANIEELLASENQADKEKGELLQAARNKATINERDTSYSIKLSATGVSADGKNYRTGTNYLIRIEGEDLEGNDIVPKGGEVYKFIFKSGTAPVIAITGGTENNSIQNRPHTSPETENVSGSTSGSSSDSGSSSSGAGSSNGANGDIAGSRGIESSQDYVFNFNGTIKTESDISSFTLFYKIDVEDKKNKNAKKISASTRELSYIPDSDGNGVFENSEEEESYLWTLNLKESSEAVKEIFSKAEAASLSLLDGLYEWKFTFWVSDGDTKSNEATVIVHVDNQIPISTITAVTPTVTYSSQEEAPEGLLAKTDYVNGIITVTGTSSDNYNLSSTTINVWLCDQDGNKLSEETFFSKTIESTVSWSVKIDTTDQSKGLDADKKTLLLEILTYDTAGNQGEIVTRLINVDQRTDMPVFKPSNTNTGMDSLKGISASSNGNLFNQNNNNKILGTVSDDDGIKKITVEYAKVTSESESPVFQTLMTSENCGSTYNLSTVLATKNESSDSVPLAEGKYKIRMTIEDTAENSSDHKTIEEFYIAIDNGAPSLSISTTEGYKPENFVVKGSASDVAFKKISCYWTKVTENNIRIIDGPAFAYWEEDGNSTGNAQGISYNRETGIWTHAYSNVTDGNTVIYQAEDEYEQTVEFTWHWNFDNKVPTSPSDEDWTKPDMSAWTSVTGQTFRIPVSDSYNKTDKALWKNESVSGIDSVTIKVDGGEESFMAQGKEYEGLEIIDTVTGPVKPYTIYTSPLILTDGSHTAVITATDQSGNSAEVGRFEVNIDTKAPSFEEWTENQKDYVKASDTLLTQEKVEAIRNGSSTFTLTVNVSDENAQASGQKVSGIRGFKLYDGNSEISSEKYSISSLPDQENGIYQAGEYTISLNASIFEGENATGTHNFYVEAIDGANNSRKESVTISVDVTSPVLSCNVPSPYVSVKENSSTVRKYNGIISVSGKVTDETELGSEDALSYEILKEDGSSFDPAKTGNVDLTGGKSSDWSFTVDTTSLTDNAATGNFKIKITAMDKVHNKADNSQNLIEIAVDQATDMPKVSLSNASEDARAYSQEAKGTNLFGMGSETIYGSVTDDDGIASVVLKIDGNSDQNIVYSPDSYNEDGSLKEEEGYPKPYFTVSGNPTSFTMEIDLTKVKNGKVISAGEHSLSIEVTDTANASNLANTAFTVNKTSVNGTYFAYDNDLPKISVVKCNDKDYTNNMWGKDLFDVYIRVSDATDAEDGKNLTVECTEILKSADGSAGSYSKYTPASEENIVWSQTAQIGGENVNATWKCPTVNVEGYFQRTYKVSDIYGRSSTTTINYIVDITPPEFQADYIALFGSSPSIASNVSASEGVVIGTSKDYWFNSEAVKLIGRGTSDENQALVEENPDSITIKVNNTNEYPVNAGKFNVFNSTISFEDGQNSLSIDAKDKAGLSATSFTTIVKVDTKEPSITSAAASATEINSAAKAALATNPFYITVTGARDANANAIGGIVSGISGFKVYRGSVDVTAYASVKTGPEASAATAVKTNGCYADGTYYIHLSQDALDTGKSAFYVEAIDQAGNISAKAETQAVEIDVTSPVISFNRPSPYVSVKENSQTIYKYNGIVSVSGSVTDETKLSSDNTSAAASAETRSISWEVKNSSGQSLTSPVRGFAALSGGTTSSFNFNINTKEIEEISGTYRIYISAKDAVGNSVDHAGDGSSSGAGFDYIEILVDQNTDRPAISFNELTSPSDTIRKYTTSITGMITDDDDISEFYVSSGYTYATDGAGHQTSTPLTLEINESTDEDAVNASWESYKTYFNAKTQDEQKAILEWTSNASFTYTPEDAEDGSHDLYFYVKDSGGSVFFTKKTLGSQENPGVSDVLRPYLTLKGGSKTDNSAKISYKTDSKPPRLTQPQYRFGSVSKTNSGDNRYTLGEYIALPPVIKVGGVSYAVFQIKITPTDDLGIASVTGELEGQTITFTKDLNSDDYISEEIFIGRYSNVNESSGWTTGSSYNLVITGTDNSGLTAPLTTPVAIDNDPPVVESIQPSSTTMKTGSFSISGTTRDVGDSGDISTLKYLVMNSDYSEKTDAELITTIKNSTQELDEGSTTKNFVFTFDGVNNPAFPARLAELTKYAEYKNENSDYYNIPVYFLAIDAFGNESLKTDYYVFYNPFSDRPTVELYTPAEGEQLSGQIRVSGSAEDSNGGSSGSVDSVYIQIDVNKDGSFTAADMTTLLSLGYTVYAVNDIYTNAEYSSYKDTNLLLCNKADNTEADSSFWGIKCSGSSSWYGFVNNGNNLQLNAIKETDGPDEVYPLSVRAAAIDSTGVLGSWSDKVSFKLNPNSPTFGSAVTPKLSDGSNTINYSELGNSYIHGSWSLITSVEHSAGIKDVYYVLNGAAPVYIVQNSVIKKADMAEAIENGYKLTIPVTGNDGEGTSTLTIHGIEKTLGRSNSAIYTVNYDNAAPSISISSLNQNDEVWTTDSVLKNSNNALVIGSNVEDGSSGLNRVLFYFYRSDAKGKRIFDAGMNSKDSYGNYLETFTSEGKNYPGLKVSDLTGEEASGLSFMTIDEKPLYGYKASGLTRSSETAISGLAENIHIRKGSIVYIGNAYHKITNVETEAGSMTLTITPSCPTSETSAFFPYAMSVDNFNRESIKKFTTEGQTITNDDGDGMPESMGGMANSRSWTAQLHANWMPDGPITFVMFAFDGAGNVTSEEISCKLETSAPRLAKVHLGTDLNANDAFTKNEFETYNFLGVEGAYQDAFALTTKAYNEVLDGESLESSRAAFKVKNKLAIVPEFTGGNGEIYLVFNNNDTTTTLDDQGFVETAGYMSSTTSGTTTKDTLNSSKGTVEGLGHYYQIDTNQLGSSSTSDTDYKKMSFTFWDSTDGLTAGTTSQKCFLSVRDILIQTSDTVNPNVVVDKFFWNGLGNGNNSLYLGSKDNGHIELEDDLPAGTFKVTNKSDAEGATAPSGEFDRDPKVSGKIVIRGSAYDDTFLKKLSFTMGDFDSGSENTIATYTNGTWVLSANTLENSPYYKVLSVEDDYFNQNGHRVKWEIAIDTSKIASVAKEDLSFTVTATDNASHSSEEREASENQADSEKHRPSYQMDVVPYIAGIKTGLSSLKKNNSSVYDRTSLGHYSVSDTEDIYIYGFNLEGGTLYDSAATPATAELTETAVASTMKWYTSTLPFSKVYKTTYDSDVASSGLSAFVSGPVYIKVGDMVSLNNKNENDSFGSAYESTPEVGSTGSKSIYDNFYNRQPNGDNNNLLTDDVKLDIWQINSEAGKPKSGPLSQPVMAINPVNKQVGFAFANGPLHFSMGNLSKSYMTWEGGLDFWTSIGFVYDANGNSFGTAAGGDINSTPDADQFGIFTSRWGDGGETGTVGHNCGKGWLRLEMVGQAESTDGSSFNGNNVNKQRIQSSSIAATVASDTATNSNVYLAYYDAINDEVRFRWGIFSNSDNKVRSNDANDLFEDYYGNPGSQGSTDNANNTKSKTQTKTVASTPYTLEYVSLIAGQTTGKKTFYKDKNNATKYYTANTAVTTSTGKAVCAGQYVSIAAKYQGGDTYEIGTEEIPVIDEETGEPVVDEETGEPVTETVSVNFTDDLVVAVWYDATNNQMLYSYNTAPHKIKALTYKGTDRTIDSYSQSATGWSTPEAIFGEGSGIGEYCKVALDAQGKVHIACYDNANADVWYAYIDDYASPENAKTCIVDSYGIVGTELYLDVALKDSNPVPYISYYGSSCARPKVAYWASETSIASATDLYGAEDEAATGNWEVSVIPSSSKISIDHINVGVWKDSSGNLTYSTTNGKAPGSEGTLGTNSAGTDNGMIYGNGSMNPILGYAITKGSGGFIETAQMK